VDDDCVGCEGMGNRKEENPWDFSLWGKLSRCGYWGRFHGIYYFGVRGWRSGCWKPEKASPL
jgi:hypothetical protein